MKKISKIVLVAGLAIFLTLPLFGHAAIKKASQNVYLGSEEIHEGNYYAAGNAIEIAGTVNGDVFVAGNTVRISGTVNGDVFAGASNIIISGEIDGSVRVAGSYVSIDGKIFRNFMGAGSSLVINENAEVGKHVSLAGAFIDVRGNVGGNLEATGDTLNIASEIGGKTNLYFEAGERVVLLPSTHLMGNLDYTSKDKLIIKEGAQIGRGAAWFFLVPIACIILLITVIGIPLALIIGVLYPVMLYFGTVFASIALGLLITKSLGLKKASLIFSMIIGVIVLMVLKCLPIIGWLICLVAMCWGLGALIEMKKKAWKEMR